MLKNAYFCIIYVNKYVFIHMDLCEYIYICI
jgi:hypothetical protein